MGGEHVCVGCGALHGTPHKENCVRVTRERWAMAEPGDVLSPLQPTAPGLSRLLVNDEDCSTAIQYVKEYARDEPDAAPNWENAEKVAQEQLYGALNMDPHLNSQTRIALALTSIAAGQIALAQEVRAVRARLDLPTQVMLAPDDDGYVDQIVKEIRRLPDVLHAAIADALRTPR